MADLVVDIREPEPGRPHLKVCYIETIEAHPLQDGYDEVTMVYFSSSDPIAFPERAPAEIFVMLPPVVLLVAPA
jgi:hypothetical protein